ncbi:hypothetical protein A5733_26230 [Mycobacterium sp. NS-7484]|uniref:phage upper tail fiber protein n=1 Tax=Mycobacterium sp. NS-7484 TaxID=1834161 RepID=UPI00096D7ECF|nr:hypothetical protein [Mycobacterium sp. NS-7484]OMC01982.1 hypothetical protein A5733_26230 [Mycobacterium sp. NS-7484]
MALPTNWVDGIGMVEDAEFLNQVGTEVNSNTDALSGKKLRVMTLAAYTALATKDANAIYFVTA